MAVVLCGDSIIGFLSGCDLSASAPIEAALSVDVPARSGRQLSLAGDLRIVDPGHCSRNLRFFGHTLVWSASNSFSSFSSKIR
jgi:hypothetical protein